jgi:hypothetical protein
MKHERREQIEQELAKAARNREALSVRRQEWEEKLSS